MSQDGKSGLEYIRDIARQALAHADSLLHEWLPTNKTQGCEFVALNPKRVDSRLGSFKVNMNTGVWADYAYPSIKGPDLVALYAYLNDLSQIEAANAIAKRISAQQAMLRIPKFQPDVPEKMDEQIVPIPSSIRQPDYSHPNHGKPHAIYTYTNGVGQPMFYVLRWDIIEDGRRKKEVRPCVYTRSGWRLQGLKLSALPLYNLRDVFLRHDATVIVVEGEKAADAARALFPDMVAVTSSSGAQSYWKTDWTPLAKRTVIIWPDNDQAGRTYAKGVYDTLTPLGADVRIVEIPQDAFPVGWDLADPVPEGMDIIAMARLAGEPPPPPPIPMDDFDWEPSSPTFPVEALPEWFRNWAESVASSIQCPVDMPAALGMVAFSYAMSGKYELHLKENNEFIERPSLYWFIGLGSGERKTPVCKIVVEPIRQFEGEAIREAMQNRTLMKAEIERAEEELANAVEAALDGDYSAAEDARYAEKKLDRLIRRSYIPQCLADDATQESLISLLHRNGERIAIISDEDKMSKIMLGRYANNHQDIAVYLAGYSASRYIKNRVSHEPIVLNAPIINIGMCVQPSILEEFGKVRGFRSQGLSARFFYSIPKGMAGNRSVRALDISVDKELAANYRDSLLNVLRIPQEEDEDGNRIARKIKLTPDAMDVQRQVDEWIDRQIHPITGRLRGIVEWANKGLSHMFRVAMVLHAIEQSGAFVDPENHIARPISGETMRNALKILHYLIDHAIRAHQKIGCTGDSDDHITSSGRDNQKRREILMVLDAIIEVCDDHKRQLAAFPDDFRLHEIYERMKGVIVEKVLKEYIKTLCDGNYIRMYGSSKSGCRMNTKFRLINRQVPSAAAE